MRPSHAAAGSALVALATALPPTALALPQIDEVAWGPSCVGVPTGSGRFVKEGVPGNELMRVTVNVDGTQGEPGDTMFPDALCNDGTPAIYYVRAGDAPDTDRWIVTLHGAGACSSYETCYARWCTGTNYTAEWMSSDESFATVLGGGILLDAPDLNRFAGWNHVFVHYCSSDQWAGRLDGVPFYGGGDPAWDYEVPYHGADIVDAVLEELRENPKKLQDLGMPSLDEASMLLFGASTSGATGVNYHLDRVAETLRLTNPTLDIRGVFDSNVYPAADTITAAGGPYTGVVDPAVVDSYAVWADSFAVYGSQTDESCLAVHGGTADEWWCTERMHLLTLHTATPFFVHADLMDPENPLCGTAHGEPIVADCEAALAEQIEALADIANDGIPREVPAEYDGLLPGYHAPRCGFTSHSAFSSPDDDDGFFDVKIPVGDPPTEWLSFHDVLWNWVEGNGGPTTLLRDPDAADPCPSPPPNVPIFLTATVEETILLTWTGGTYDAQYTAFWSTADDLDEDSAVLAVTTEPYAAYEGVIEPLLCFAVRAENPVGTSPLTSPLCLDFDADDDGVLDEEDVCGGADDLADTDADGVPDGCDTPPADTGTDITPPAVDPDPTRCLEDRCDDGAACGCGHAGGSAGLLPLLLVAPWYRRRRQRPSSS